MRKIMVMSTFIMLLLMTGIASAGITANLQVSNDPIVLDIGFSASHDLEMTTNDNDTGVAVSVPLDELRILNVPSGFGVKVDSVSYTPNGSGTINIDLSPLSSPRTWDIEYTNNGAANGQYTVTYEVEYHFADSSETWEKATNEAGIVGIPEFPTIALPIAAVLGLMFIISSRKKKE